MCQQEGNLRMYQDDINFACHSISWSASKITSKFMVAGGAIVSESDVCQDA